MEPIDNDTSASAELEHLATPDVQPNTIVTLLSTLLTDEKIPELYEKLHVSKKTVEIIKVLMDKLPEFFDDLEINITKILADGALDITDVPVMMMMMTDICNINIPRLSKDIKKITVDESTQFIKDIVLILIEYDKRVWVIEKDIVVKMIDVSITLLKSTVVTSNTVSSIFSRCCL